MELVSLLHSHCHIGSLMLYCAIIHWQWPSYNNQRRGAQERDEKDDSF